MTQSAHGGHKTSGDNPKIPPCFSQGVIRELSRHGGGERGRIDRCLLLFSGGQ